MLYPRPAVSSEGTAILLHSFGERANKTAPASTLRLSRGTMHGPCQSGIVVEADLLVAIVDDDASVRTALGALVRALGYRQIGFASAEAFLQAMEDEPVTCLITDLHLPGIDGVALKGVLDGQACPLPIIMITARDDDDLSQRAGASGARALLRKPFRARDLEQALHDALQGPPG